MRISKIRIQNFRLFEDLSIDLGDYTCFVGPNGAGKSTVLTALRIFFRDILGSSTDLLNLQEEDFHQRNTSKPIEITLTFTDIGDEAQKDLAHYVRLSQLVVSAIANWDSASRVALVKQYGERLAMVAFSPFFEAEANGAKVADLRRIYNELRNSCQDLPEVATKGAMIEALHNYEESHPELCQLIRSEDRFYGFAGESLLEKHIQWILVPAVKDAATEQFEGKKTALSILLERTVRSKLSFREPIASLYTELEKKYQTILGDHQASLDELSTALDKRIKEWAHPGASMRLKWHDDTSEYIKLEEPYAKAIASEGPFEGSLPRFGHGLQRSFLLALLQELSGSGGPNGPRLVLGCEEPELYQHPPQARHLAAVLQKLTTQNSQVVISTHSPYFVSGQSFDSVRLFRHGTDPSVRRATVDELAKTITEVRGDTPAAPAGMILKVEQALQPSLSEMFFASVLVLVEGLEDMAYTATYLTLMNLWEDFRRLGCHVVATFGKGKMLIPLAIAKHLEIPTFVIFDADGHKPDKQGSRAMHERDNLAIVRLCGVPNADAFPSTTFRTSNLTMWPDEISEVVKAEIGDGDWTACEASVRERHEIDAADLQKNYMFIGYILTEAWNRGKRSPSLIQVCQDIASYARAVRTLPEAKVEAPSSGRRCTVKSDWD